MSAPALARPHRRRRLAVAGAAVVVVGAAIAAVVASGVLDGDGGASVTPAVATSTAAVERRDLVDRDDYDGTLTYADATTVASGRAGTVTAVAREGATLEAGDELYRVDGRPILLLDGATPAWRSLGLGVDATALATQRAGVLTARAEAGATLRAGDVLYRVDGQPAVLMNAPGVAWRALSSGSDDGPDVLWLERNLRALGYDADDAMTIDQSWGSATTAAVEAMQEDLGATVDGALDLGDVVFADGPQRVAEAEGSGSTGSAVATDAALGASLQAGAQVLRLRSLAAAPSAGPDVRELERNLVELGYDPQGAIAVDGTYDAASDAALRRLQKDRGLVVDGILDLGEAVFLDGPQRVASATLAPGASASAGAPALDVTSTRQLVTLDLAASRRSIIEVGDAVTVTLPDASTVDGTVQAIGAVATTAASTTGDAADPTVTVEIALAKDTDVGLDQAPVDVGIANDARSGVLAVPVSALLAVTGGGYAVQVVDGGSSRYVAVEPGLFADGMVEITGDVAEGATVVVPA